MFHICANQYEELMIWNYQVKRYEGIEYFRWLTSGRIFMYPII